MAGLGTKGAVLDRVASWPLYLQLRKRPRGAERRWRGDDAASWGRALRAAVSKDGNRHSRARGHPSRRAAKTRRSSYES